MPEVKPEVKLKQANNEYIDDPFYPALHQAFDVYISDRIYDHRIKKLPQLFIQSHFILFTDAFMKGLNPFLEETKNNSHIRKMKGANIEYKYTEELEYIREVHSVYRDDPMSEMQARMEFQNATGRPSEETIDLRGDPYLILQVVQKGREIQLGSSKKYHELLLRLKNINETMYWTLRFLPSIKSLEQEAVQESKTTGLIDRFYKYHEALRKTEEAEHLMVADAFALHCVNDPSYEEYISKVSTVLDSVEKIHNMFNERGRTADDETRQKYFRSLAIELVLNPDAIKGIHPIESPETTVERIIQFNQQLYDIQLKKEDFNMVIFYEAQRALLEQENKLKKIFETAGLSHNLMMEYLSNMLIFVMKTHPNEIFKQYVRIGGFSNWFAHVNSAYRLTDEDKVSIKNQLPTTKSSTSGISRAVARIKETPKEFPAYFFDKMKPEEKKQVYAKILSRAESDSIRVLYYLLRQFDFRFNPQKGIFMTNVSDPERKNKFLNEKDAEAVMQTSLAIIEHGGLKLIEALKHLVYYATVTSYLKGKNIPTEISDLTEKTMLNSLNFRDLANKLVIPDIQKEAVKDMVTYYQILDKHIYNIAAAFLLRCVMLSTIDTQWNYPINIMQRKIFGNKLTMDVKRRQDRDYIYLIARKILYEIEDFDTAKDLRNLEGGRINLIGKKIRMTYEAMLDEFQAKALKEDLEDILSRSLTVLQETK